ncbi:Alpha/Beta hydrolase protein [Podospora fimiseda]|uniref:Alpha/Beta hydrolase protein n=1 Tax=Podospora fimiseda TaxID=252190 RepID=A0AAN7BP57_9PEZI|nr:Alpha/Beta hydrolase protein [Podospora fimiseda]
MFETFTYKHLHFHPPPPSPPIPPLPPSITRLFIPTPSGDLEILYSAPKNPPPSNVSPIFFVHGGMGSAWVWLPYLTYLSQNTSIPSYAISLRGHGNSWHPSYLRMVFFTTKHMLATDIVAGIEFVESRHEGQEIIYVGHSSGGGLGQYILSEQLVKVKALVLAAAVPGFGSLSVYINWWRLDPWFNLRMIFHLYHPNSPLSHPTLTRRVFFSSPSYPQSSLLEFQSHTSRYESFLWPLGMLFKFTNPHRLLSSITSASKTKVLVLAGEKDVIMTRGIMEQLGGWYRSAGYKRIDGEEEIKELEGADGDTEGKGARIVYVPGVGHHLQNDFGWEVGVRKLVEFVEGL